MRKCDKAREHDAIDDALENEGITLKDLYFLMKEKHQIQIRYGTYYNYFMGYGRFTDLALIRWSAEELKMPVEVFNECLNERCNRYKQRKRKTKVVDRSAHEGNFKIVPPANPKEVERYLYGHDTVRVNLLMDEDKYIGELCDNIAKTDLPKLLYGHLSYEDFAKFDDCYGDKGNNDWLVNVINTIIINVAEDMKETNKDG